VKECYGRAMYGITILYGGSVLRVEVLPEWTVSRLLQLKLSDIAHISRLKVVHNGARHHLLGSLSYLSGPSNLGFGLRRGGVGPLSQTTRGKPSGPHFSPSQGGEPDAGRLLRNDEVLSAAGVHDGHTLHLVVQPHPTPSTHAQGPSLTPSTSHASSSPTARDAEGARAGRGVERPLFVDLAGFEAALLRVPPELRRPRADRVRSHTHHTRVDVSLHFFSFGDTN
jgi:hypothetical protein